MARAKASIPATALPPLRPEEISHLKLAIKKGVFKLYQDFPFWAFLIEKCRIIATRGIPRAGVTEKGELFINPDYFRLLSPENIQFVLAHEVMHLVLEHFSRLRGRDRNVWNIAGDACINDFLIAEFANDAYPVSDIVTGPSLAQKVHKHIDTMAMTTEDIYALIPPKSVDKMGDGDMMVGGTGGSDSEVIRENTEDSPQTSSEWQQAGVEAMVRTKLAGTASGGLERIISGTCVPRIPWNEVFAEHVKSRLCMGGRERTTFLPPSRRWADGDVIMPSRVGTRGPKVAFCIDTSGSMIQEDISMGVAEMDSIRKLYKADLYWMECDAAVTGARWITRWDPIPKVKGGGGTSFVPVMEHLAAHNVDVDLLVYFTDGYGDFGDAPPFPVVWVLTNSDVKPPYGQVVRVDPR